MSSEDDESLLRRARSFVRAELVEPEDEDITAESPAKRQKIDWRPNSKMEKAWFLERRGQTRGGFHEDELDKYEAVSLPFNFSSLDWWSTSGGSICRHLVPIARRVLAMQATSCEAERSFSGLRRILRWDRTSMDGATLSQIATVRKNWDVIGNFDNVARLSEAEARAWGVGPNLYLLDLLEDEEENTNVNESPEE